MAIFDEELRSLKEKVLKVGSLVETALHDSIRSLVERDSDLAQKVIKKVAEAAVKNIERLQAIAKLPVMPKN